MVTLDACRESIATALRANDDVDYTGLLKFVDAHHIDLLKQTRTRSRNILQSLASALPLAFTTTCGLTFPAESANNSCEAATRFMDTDTRSAFGDACNEPLTVLHNTLRAGVKLSLRSSLDAVVTTYPAVFEAPVLPLSESSATALTNKPTHKHTQTTKHTTEHTNNYTHNTDQPTKQPTNQPTLVSQPTETHTHTTTQINKQGKCVNTYVGMYDK